MKLTKLLTAGALASIMAAPVMADNPTTSMTLTPEQKKQMEQVIHDYIVNNPEVLVEASQALQQKQQQSMLEQAKSAISENAPKLFSEKLSVGGNPDGNVTLVEFFDYQCIHCKKMQPVIDALVKSDPNLRVVYKEFPIFGKSSELASQAALAAGMQGKYQQMHDALLGIDKRLNETIILDTAKTLGLDVNKLKKDMQSKEITDALAANRELGEKLHLMGTPAFIVAATPAGQFKEDSNPSFIPGAATQDNLQSLIGKTRDASS